MSEATMTALREEHVVFYLISFCILGLFFVARKSKNDKYKKSSKWSLVLTVIFCLALALLIGTKFDTAPVSSDYTGADSSVFIYIGKGMHEGKTPYVDLFDHKGPVLYFIQFLGLALTPDSYLGIWLIEVLAMAMSLFFIIKTARLITKSTVVSYLAAIFVGLILGTRVYQGGNLTEEYALPWLCAALYIFFKFFLTGKYSRSGLALLGVSFAMTLFLRVNLVALWVALVPIVLFRLIRQSKWGGVIECVGWFLGGAALVTIPLIVYCLTTGCLEAMFEYYILFNLSYASGGNLWNNFLGALKIVVKHLWPLVLVGVLTIVQNLFAVQRNRNSLTVRFLPAAPMKRLYQINLWLALVSVLLGVMGGRTYAHYLIILLPVAVVPLVDLLNRVDTRLTNWLGLGLTTEKFKLSGLIITGCFMVYCVIVYNRVIAPELVSGRFYEPLAEYIEAHSDTDDDVLVIGNRVITYLESNRTTKNKFFYQAPPVTVSDKLYAEFMQELDAKQPDLVIITQFDECVRWMVNDEESICAATKNYLMANNYIEEAYDGYYSYLKEVK